MHHNKKTLRECVEEARSQKVAIGHFNISNIEGFWAIVKAAEVVGVPVIIGVSEGERDFIGVKQVKALVDSVQESASVPVFLNADHTYSVERVKEVIDAGFDAAIFDGAKLSYEENIQATAECVAYAKEKNPEVLIEAELGYIGQSSKILDEIPEGASQGETLTTPEQAKEFAEKTGIHLLAPAVGSIHGMMRSGVNPALNIERIQEIHTATGLPLVLHGGSGNTDADFVNAIRAGITIVHINTEIRVAYRDALKRTLQENPDEVAPYKIMKSSVEAMQKVIEKKLALFSGK